jgi:hypothetical protein
LLGVRENVWRGCNTTSYDVYMPSSNEWPQNDYEHWNIFSEYSNIVGSHTHCKQ